MKTKIHGHTISFKPNAANILYALIGATAIVWIWFYLAYIIFAMIGENAVKDFNINVEVNHNER